MRKKLSRDTEMNKATPHSKKVQLTRKVPKLKEYLETSLVKANRKNKNHLQRVMQQGKSAFRPAWVAKKLSQHWTGFFLCLHLPCWCELELWERGIWNPPALWFFMSVAEAALQQDQPVSSKTEKGWDREKAAPAADSPRPWGLLILTPSSSMCRLRNVKMQ